jgi:hypothetical protein
MGSILDFQTALEESARPNLFRVTINFPLMCENATEATRRSTYLTMGGNIPSSTIQDVIIQFRGRELHEAGERQFQPWQCTIYNDANYTVRGALESWVANIRTPSSTDGSALPQDYKSTITVEQLNRAGETTRIYYLYGAYPTEVEMIQLDYTQATQIEQYGVTFAYDYFTVA